MGSRGVGISARAQRDRWGIGREGNVGLKTNNICGGGSYPPGNHV